MAKTKKAVKKEKRPERPELPDSKTGASIEYEHADKLLELMLKDKMTKLFLETALGKDLVPVNGDALGSISAPVCIRNQEFLSALIHFLRIVWYRIDVSDKQKDIFEEGEEKGTDGPQRPSKAKEEKLAGVLEGEPVNGEFSEDFL